MTALRWLGLAAGVVLVLVTARSMCYTLVVPQRAQTRLPGTVFGAVRGFAEAVARRMPSYEARDRLLSLAAPFGVLSFLAVWLVLFLIGFGLILLPLTGADLTRVLRESGSSLLTLGVVAHRAPAAMAVDLCAAAAGLGTVALLIGYLPALYGAFNRRETLVTLLQSRAGAPAWGPEILARHELVGIVDRLPDLYGRWEEWSADVAESHTNYPVLVFFRSPHPLRSWVLALLAVLDAAALHLALCPAAAPAQARLCLRMGFTCLRDVADVLGLPYDPDPSPDDPILLTFEEFRGAIKRLDDAGFARERSPEDAWPHFRGWRVNYEAIAYRLADLVTAPPGPWSGPRRALEEASLVPQRPLDRKPAGPGAGAS